MDIEKWLAQQEQATKPKPKARNAIRHIDRFDREDLAAMRDEVKQYRRAREQLIGVAENTGGSLTDDASMMLFKVTPEMEERGNMDPRFLLNHAVEQELGETPEMERLRTWTEGDIVNTALSFVDIEPLLEQLLDKKSHEFEEAAQALEKLQQQLAEMLQQASNLGDLVENWQQGGIFDPDGDEATGGQELLDNLNGEIADLQEQVAEAETAMDKQAGQAARNAMPGLRVAVEASADKAERQADMCRGFGIEPGQLQRMNANERIKMAQRFDRNETFKKLADLIGPMMRLAAAEQMRKVTYSPEEVYDVETGRELGRLLPSELLDFLRPATRRHFYQRFLEGNTLQYAMRGQEKVGKGGIIMCLDNSGSMGGDREVWAKAVGLATAAIAREQKRTFYGIHFGSAHEIKTFDFRDWSKVDFEQIIDYAEFFFGGGTDFQAPLSRSLSLLQEEEREKGFTEGDIVFVTDGMCAVRPDWLEKFQAEKERLKFTVWGVLIGGHSRISEPLQSICGGKVVTIQDLLTGNEVREMFREL
jgi:uncharacterized protein with von Willebrand factor type A (vWA) domain